MRRTWTHHEQTNSSSMNDHQVLKKLAGVHFCSTSTRKGISRDWFQDFMNQLDHWSEAGLWCSLMSVWLTPTSSSVENRSIWPAALETCWTTEPSWWRRCCWWIGRTPENRQTALESLERVSGSTLTADSSTATDYRPCRVLPRSRRRCWRQTWPRRCTSYGRPGSSGRKLWGPGRNTHHE